MKVVCRGCRSSGILLRGAAASAGPWKMDKVSLGLGAGFLPRETTRKKARAVANYAMFCGAAMRPSPRLKGAGKW